MVRLRLNLSGCPPSRPRIGVRIIVVALALFLVLAQMKLFTSLYRKSHHKHDESRFIIIGDTNNGSLGARANTVLHEGDISPVKWNPVINNHLHTDSYSSTEQLANKTRILCWIMTQPSTIHYKAIHVKKTWGRKCTILLFMSSVADTSLPAIGLNTSEGRSYLTDKTFKAFQYVYKHHYKDADWFLKADDDTYVIMENLRYFLANENPRYPVYFGHKFDMYLLQGYHSGGSGYVISSEALHRYALLHTAVCETTGENEDVQFGACMELIGVKALDSRDSLGRERFLCLSPESYLTETVPSWYSSYHKQFQANISDVSDYTISFHYVPPRQMYFLEFYLYHLRPHGVQFRALDLNIQRPGTGGGV